MKKLLTLFVIVVGLSGALVSCDLVSCDKAPQKTSFIGYIEANYLYVSPAQPGLILTQQVVEGDVVTTGQVLYTLDATPQNAAYAQAQAQVARAEAQLKDLETGARAPEIAALQAQLREAEARFTQAKIARDRIMPLVEDGIEAKIRGDQVIADFVSAQAQVAAAKDNITVARLAARDETRAAAAAALVSAEAAMKQAQWSVTQQVITAPANGRVEQVLQRPGEYAVTGKPMLAMLPEAGLKVRFFVPEAALARLQNGQEIEFSADGLTAPVKAKITYIAREAEFTPPIIYSAESREKLVFLVEATLPALPNIHPGLPVDVTLSKVTQ